jgi:hypothetical protein
MRRRSLRSPHLTVSVSFVPALPPGRLRCAAALVALLFASLAAAFGVAPAAAQPEGVPHLDDDLHDFLLRQQARGLLPDAHLSHRPLSAYEAERYLDSLGALRGARRAVLTEWDRRRLARFQGRAEGPGTAFVQGYAPFLYRNGEHFFVAEGEDYAVQIEPLFYFDYGRARQTAIEDRDATVPVWQNTRGARVGGHVGDYVFFETELRENQRRDPDALRPPLDQRGRTAPRLGNTRFPSDGGATYDYFRATGVVGVRTEHFEARFGRDRNHWGPGETSLVLSGYAPAYDQLQLRTTFWRVQYTNVFASMTDLTPQSFDSGSSDLPNKFGAFHRLAFDLPAGVELGLFESVIFAPDDDQQTRFDIEPAYLNPVIFYRAVERDLGSPDNVLLGVDADWTTPLQGFDVYGQFMLDEFIASEIFTDSWTSKYGLLMGARLAGLPTETLALDDLTLAFEYARLRPYLYTHRDPSTSYTHYNDLFGHPAGPNAENFALFARYRPFPRVEAALNVAYTRRGRAPTDSLGNEMNVGADPLKSFNTRSSDEAPFLDGVRQNRWLIEARAGYEVLPDLFLEATLRFESVDDAGRGLDRYVAPSLALRWGLPFRSARY